MTSELPGAVRRLGPGESGPDAGRYALRFERTYAAPVEEVWSAITEPARLERWIGALLGDPVAGGELRLVMGDGDEQYADLVVRECAPRSALELGRTFPGEAAGTVRVRLTPVEGGTRLLLDHAGLGTNAANYACGWEYFVAALGSELAGAELPEWDEYFPGRLDRWREELAAAEAG